MMSMKNLLRVAMLLFVGEIFASSWQPATGFISGGGEVESYRIESDTMLFYRAVYDADDLYGRLSDYNLPQVQLRRRGERYDAERFYVENLRVDVRYRAAFGMLDGTTRTTSGLMGCRGLAGVTSTNFDGAMPHRRYRAQVRFTDRNYTAGARIGAQCEWGSGWRGTFALDGRTGRDLHVEGLFTNAVTLAANIDRRVNASHRVGLAVALPLSQRGTRLGAAEECFTLTGDPLYNPAWGFQNGRVRNSRVRREFLPTAILHYEGRVADNLTLTAAFGVETGRRGYTSLGWYNAVTPMPDNYRKLPSFTGDEATREVWRTEQSRYTQVNWDEMIRLNAMTSGDARYALEERVERPTRLSAAVAVTSQVGRGMKLRLGVDVSHSALRNFKVMDDLLGAEYLTDIDYFLVDDRTVGNSLQNNLQHPNHRIGVGDRFGYDYTLRCRDAALRAELDWRPERGYLRLAAEVGCADIRREGHYEKELYRGSESLGCSPTRSFATCGFSAVAGWNFSPRSTLHLALTAALERPDADAIFVQPQYRNLTVLAPEPERSMGAELRYRLTRRHWQLQAAAYVTRRADIMTSLRYFDDLSGHFADLTASGVGTLAVGAELAAEYDITDSWRIFAALLVGRAKYNSDPRLTIIADAENTLIDHNAASRMGGCDVGGVPRVTAVAGVSYNGEKGWGIRLTAGYAAGRRVEPSLLRRTARVTAQAATTPEAFAAFTRQERLRDAFTLDCGLYKRFDMGHGNIVASLSLRNLTANQAQYSGYESLRVRRISAGDESMMMPHATRYTYAYPRSFYLSVSYNF